MSAGRFLNHMRLQAMMAAGNRTEPRVGLVTSYDPDAIAVKVTLQPEGIETGWLSIKTLVCGDGWGVFCGPTQGMQALVLFQEGDRESGVCIGFLPSDDDRPPAAVPAGEMHVIHQDGAHLKFLAGGIVEMVAPGGFNVTADTTITGKLHATGDTTLGAKLNVTGVTTAAEIDSSGPIKVGGVTVVVP